MQIIDSRFLTLDKFNMTNTTNADKPKAKIQLIDFSYNTNLFINLIWVELKNRICVFIILLRISSYFPKKFQLQLCFETH